MEEILFVLAVELVYVSVGVFIMKRFMEKVLNDATKKLLDEPSCPIEKTKDELTCSTERILDAQNQSTERILDAQNQSTERIMKKLDDKSLEFGREQDKSVERIVDNQRHIFKLMLEQQFNSENRIMDTLRWQGGQASGIYPNPTTMGEPQKSESQEVK